MTRLYHLSYPSNTIELFGLRFRPDDATDGDRRHQLRPAWSDAAPSGSSGGGIRTRVIPGYEPSVYPNYTTPLRPSPVSSGLVVPGRVGSGVCGALPVFSPPYGKVKFLREEVPYWYLPSMMKSAQSAG